MASTDVQRIGTVGMARNSIQVRRRDTYACSPVRRRRHRPITLGMARLAHCTPAGDACVRHLSARRGAAALEQQLSGHFELRRAVTALTGVLIVSSGRTTATQVLETGDAPPRPLVLDGRAQQSDGSPGATVTGARDGMGVGAAGAAWRGLGGTQCGCIHDQRRLLP